jgi:condensin complex subunit 1
MMGMAKKSIISDNLHLVTKIGLGELAKDLQVAKYACIAIQKMCIVKHEKGSLAPPYDRKPANHITIQVIIDLMMKSSGVEWFGFAEQAISAIYCFVQNPDKVCTELIAKMTCRVFSVSETAEDQIESLAKNLVGMNIDGANNQSIMSTESRVPISYLAQLIYIVGHVAMKQIVYLEQIESEYKRLKAMNISQKTKDDLEMVTGSAEDEFMDRMQFVKEKELLYGSKSLLATFTPLIVHLVKNPHAEYEWLNIAANLALLKFCCISPTFCEQNLPLLFQSLEQSKSFAVRSNSIIGLGDLIISFNSLIDPHIGFLYSRLRDSNFQVKKITFMVLTFLILNGMVKIKGQISEMAKCLEDPEKRIRDLAKLFFTELSLKDNAIYNNLPDIISNLDCDQTQFRKIMKFIMGFISKSRQTETIIEKLLQRFDHDSERSWEDMAFCISLLSFQTEKSLKKLVDSLPLYQNKLHSDNVYKSFNEIVAKVKSNPKIDKALVDSFRDSIEAARQSCLENYAATTAAVADNSLSTRSPQDRLDLDEEKENDIVENNSTKAKPIGKKLVKVAPKRKIRKYMFVNLGKYHTLTNRIDQAVFCYQFSIKYQSSFFIYVIFAWISVVHQRYSHQID